jgi:hypothetical protein
MLSTDDQSLQTQPTTTTNQPTPGAGVVLPRLLTNDQAAAYLGITPSALETRRSRKMGPPFFRDGRVVRYRRSDLEAYVESKIVHPEAA